MSHANGEVIKDGATIAWFEYDGTSDVACWEIYSTYEEMTANWRKRRWPECTCGKPPESVLLQSDYGGGIGPWPALVCLSCMCIVDGDDPYEKPGVST